MSVPVRRLANVVVVAHQDLLSPLYVGDGPDAHDQTKPGQSGGTAVIRDQVRDRDVATYASSLMS